MHDGEVFKGLVELRRVLDVVLQGREHVDKLPPHSAMQILLNVTSMYYVNHVQ